MGRRKTPTHTVGKIDRSLNAQILGASKEVPMKVREGLTKPSESDKVDAYMNNLKHPLAGVAKALREIILKTDPEIGEEIKWNATALSGARCSPRHLRRRAAERGQSAPGPNRRT